MEKLIALARTHLVNIDQVQYLELVEADTLRPTETPLRRSATFSRGLGGEPIEIVHVNCEFG